MSSPHRLPVDSCDVEKRPVHLTRHTRAVINIKALMSTETEDNTEVQTPRQCVYDAAAIANRQETQHRWLFGGKKKKTRYKAKSDTHTHACTHAHTEQGASSEVLLVEVEAEVFTLSLDDFGQSRRAAVEHVDFPFILLGHLLEHLTHTTPRPAEHSSPTVPPYSRRVSSPWPTPVVPAGFWSSVP